VTALTTGAAPAEALAGRAREAGHEVVAEAAWPEHDGDAAVPALAGFVVSSFSPLAAEAANRCLGRRPAGAGTAPDPRDPDGPVTAVVLVTARGDVQSARHVADAVDTGARIGPLMFFQSVPNAVAGHIAARWNLSGPVVCLGDPASASAAAALLLADGDADEALLVHVEQDPDRAAAVLVRPGPGAGDPDPGMSAAGPAAAPGATPRPDAPHSPEGGRP
jgi:hypothetical protein